MQQIRKIEKQKRVRKPNSFTYVIKSWCSKEYVKITFAENIESETNKVMELLKDLTAEEYLTGT